MAGPPAFQFYAGDFYVGTSHMSSAEVGMYARGMSWSWDNGPLPTEESRLARVLKVDAKEFRKLWPVVSEKWVATPGGYINMRLEQEREKQTYFRDQQARKGKASAAARWGTKPQPEGQPNGNLKVTTVTGRLQPEGQPNGNSSIYDLQSASPKDQELPGKERPESLAAAWNELTSEPIPACKELSQKRTRAAQARLKERPLDDWRTVIQRIQDSTFCQGQNDRGWVATFDWLLQPDTAVKVLEGKYDNRGSSNSHSSPPMLTPKEIRQMAHSMGSGSWASECLRLHDGRCGGPNAHRERMMQQVEDFVAGGKRAVNA